MVAKPFSDPEVEITGDGYATLYRRDIDEHYHSTKGAVAESAHVYVNTGWLPVAEAATGIVRVFEVGFGTGLNAALTAEAALRLKVPTEYYAVELHPLSQDIVARLGYGEASRFFADVNAASWDARAEINRYFTLVKANDDFLTMNLPSDLNVVYFDAFAPEKQPEMWSDELFERLYGAMSYGGVLTTYCAKGEVRRRLVGVGFEVERLPGPPNGKREIIRATKR